MQKIEKYILIVSAILAPIVITLIGYILCKTEYVEISDCNNQKMEIIKGQVVENDLLLKIKQQMTYTLDAVKCGVLSDQYCAEGKINRFVTNKLLCTIIERGINYENPSEAIAALFDRSRVSYSIFLSLIPFVLIFWLLAGSEKSNPEARKDLVAIGFIYFTGMVIFFLIITLVSKAFPGQLSNHYAAGATVFTITFIMAYNKAKDYLKKHGNDLPDLGNSWD